MTAYPPQPPHQQQPNQQPAQQPLWQQPGQQQPGQYQPGAGQGYGAVPPTPGAPAAGAGAGPGNSGAARRSAPFGGLGIVAAIVGVLVSGAFVLVQAIMIRSASWMWVERYGVFAAVHLALVTLFGVAAVVLGIVALRRRESQLLAGIAIGGGAVQLVGVLTSLFQGVLLA